MAGGGRGKERRMTVGRGKEKRGMGEGGEMTSHVCQYGRRWEPELMGVRKHRRRKCPEEEGRVISRGLVDAKEGGRWLLVEL